MQFSSDKRIENWVLSTKLKMMKDNNGDIVQGKFGSPLLEETEEKRLVSATAILEKVSVVHNCDHRCAFMDGELAVVEEREVANKERYIYQHDFSNKVYLLNRFYLGESWKYILDS